MQYHRCAEWLRIDLGGDMLEGDGSKWIKASKLAELAGALSADARVMVNTVGNLLVLSEDGAESIGMIDFICSGELELWDNPLTRPE